MPPACICSNSFSSETPLLDCFASASRRNRFGASVAEVDHHDLWQRASLTVACVARSAREAGDLAAGAERWLASGDWQLTRAERTVVSPDDREVY